LCDDQKHIAPLTGYLAFPIYLLQNICEFSARFGQELVKKGVFTAFSQADVRVMASR
jgi:hypothetical protein